jgi:Fibronectin type III domain
VTGALVLVAGAVVVLRNTDAPTEGKPPPPTPVQTTVRAFAGQGALAPQPGSRPEQPTDLTIVAGPHRLQVSWSGKTPGYEVRLRDEGGVLRNQLVAGNAVQFDGLEDSAEYQVEVRAVDSFGQRSDPSASRQRPNSNRPDESKYALIDRFDHALVPDPARWRLASNAACARMSRGVGDDSHRLVIGARCGKDPVALRSRTPLLLKEIGGELGRMMIETDYPAAGGELLLDLVPGPVDLIDDHLPPGTLRVKIMPESVTLPGAEPVAIPRRTGLSSRWELVLRTDGLSLWRNGSKIAGSTYVPTWTSATPLFGFAGPPNGLSYVGVDTIGLSSADTPVFVAPPRITATEPGQAAKTEQVAGVLGGQLRMTVRTNLREPMTPFTVEIAGREFPARPAVDGHVFAPSFRFPLVADLPADALVLSGERRELRITVRGATATISPVVQHAELELIADPAGRPSTDQAQPAPEPAERPRLTLAALSTTFLDASGRKIESDRLAVRGRVVLEVLAEGTAMQAGLAGIEVFVDNQRIVGIPTTADGPGVAGQWRIALNSGAFSPGPHTLEVKAISTDPNVAPAQATTTWSVPS